ncbi:MAG TPA: hypothetical protein VNO70_02470 [Blastocatellia bacterium]|nr:hypothetical protein [Blastocatellia bacterium]
MQDRIKQLIEDYKKRRSDTSAYAIARHYALLGEKKQALDWLEKAIHDGRGDFNLVFIGVDPVFDSLRAEPRYQDILRRMGLAP